MLSNLKKGMFPFLIAFSALSVSASAAFYSVYGLSKLFAGAQFQVIIMASSLEFAKLVTASLLYQYWGTINKALRTYLSIATIILVLITSMGIYGFLSAAYQDTYAKLSMVENQKGFIEQKIEFYENDVNRYNEEIKRISNNISTLSNARASSIQVRDTSVVGGFRTTISTTELRMAAKRIEVEEENRKDVQVKREIASDSLQKFQLEVLELDNNNEVAGELGPLQYLSGLTGYPMDKIINILLLIIIFVFDPLAISLVVAANFSFDKAYPRKKSKKNVEKESTQTLIWENDINMNETTSSFTSTHQIDKEFDNGFWSSYNEEDEQRMNIIGQNGNDGEHYEDKEFNGLDLNKDGIIDENEKLIAKDKIKELESKIKSGMSGFRINKIREEINKIKKYIG